MASSGSGAKIQEPSIPVQSVEEFERVAGYLSALHKEFAVQTKSKPDGAVNKFKLKVLNEKLGGANAFLAGTFKPFADFTLFEDTELPTNSDVALVLTTYLASLERWRSVHVFHDRGQWYWRTDSALKPRAERSTMFTLSEK